jgi:hypothetical protein
MAATAAGNVNGTVVAIGVGATASLSAFHHPSTYPLQFITRHPPFYMRHRRRTTHRTATSAATELNASPLRCSGCGSPTMSTMVSGDLGQPDGPEIPYIDANIELAR